MIWLNDPATEVMKNIVYLHHMIMYYLIVIVFFVGWMLYNLLVEYGIRKKPVLMDLSWDEYLVRRKKVEENSFNMLTLELGWTLGPSGILIIIAAASFTLLYVIDFISTNFIAVKVVGHQWYWSYEINDLYTQPSITKFTYNRNSTRIPNLSYNKYFTLPKLSSGIVDGRAYKFFSDILASGTVEYYTPKSGVNFIQYNYLPITSKLDVLKFIQHNYPLITLNPDLYKRVIATIVDKPIMDRPLPPLFTNYEINNRTCVDVLMGLCKYFPKSILTKDIIIFIVLLRIFVISIRL